MFWSRPGYAAGYGAGRRDRAAERDLDTARHLSRALFGTPRPVPVVYSEEVVRHLNAELDRIAAIANENNACFERARAGENAALAELATCRAELEACRAELAETERRRVRSEADAQMLEDALVYELKQAGVTLPCGCEASETDNAG